jgi:hypothetical protein
MREKREKRMKKREGKQQKTENKMEERRQGCHRSDTGQEDHQSQFIKATLSPKLGLWVWPVPYNKWVVNIRDLEIPLLSGFIS